MLRQIAQGVRTAAGSSLLKSSMALISGTVVTQAIVFLFSPVLSRIFSLGDFGNLANYNAWVSICALLSSLRYEHAIIIARGRESTQAVLALTAVLCLASVVVYGLIGGVIHFSPVGSGYLNAIRGFVLIIPLGVLSIGVSSALIQLNVKAGRFKRLAAVTVAQVVFTVISQIALGLLHVAHGLIVGAISGSLLSGAVLARLSARDGDFAGLRRTLTLSRLRATAAQYVNFPRYTLAADALAVVGQQFTPVFLLALFNPAAAGLYAFSIRIVRVPLLVVSTAINAVLRKDGVDHLDKEGNLQSLFKTIVRSLILLGFVPFAVILLFGDRLFSVVFGAQWAEAGRVVQILSPGILLEFIAYPLSVFFIITGSQRYAFAVQLVGFVSLLAALLLGRHYLHGFIGTCYLISAVMVLVNLASIILTSRVSGRKHPLRPDRADYAGAVPGPAGLVPAEPGGLLP